MSPKRHSKTKPVWSPTRTQRNPFTLAREPRQSPTPREGSPPRKTSHEVRTSTSGPSEKCHKNTSPSEVAQPPEHLWQHQDRGKQGYGDPTDLILVELISAYSWSDQICERDSQAGNLLRSEEVHLYTYYQNLVYETRVTKVIYHYKQESKTT